MHERHFHFHFVVAARLYETHTFLHTIVWLIYQLHCVTFLQYSWRSITPPFPNHIKLEQLNSRCSAMQPACVRHFWSNYFVITMDMINMFWAKTNLPFQSILGLENQLAHDALNELIASNYCKYCLKVVFHLKQSFCRTNYTSMMSAMC